MLVVDDWLKSSELLMSLLPGDPHTFPLDVHRRAHTHAHKVACRVSADATQLLFSLGDVYSKFCDRNGKVLSDWSLHFC